MAEKGLRPALWAVVMLTLAACAAEPAKPPPPPPPQVLQVPPPAPPPPPPRPVDQCGAVDLQYLVGRPKTEIPIPLQPDRRRVICSTCPMTQDFSPSRQTILFDADTGLVTSVRCG